MNADGSAQINLTNNSASTSTRNGRRTARRSRFVSDRDGNAEIYVMNMDGTRQTNLTNNGAPDIYPRWRP